MGGRVRKLKLGVEQAGENQGQLGRVNRVWWFRTKCVSRVNPPLTCAVGDNWAAYGGHSG